MKTLVGIFIGIFLVFMSVVFVGGFLQERTAQPGISASTHQAVGGPAQMYAVSDVASHGSLDDCWLIINNTVYDVTTYLGQHPGGASVISPYCGKEATRAFDTQDRGSSGGHSSSAAAMLENYMIGMIK